MEADKLAQIIAAAVAEAMAATTPAVESVDDAVKRQSAPTKGKRTTKGKGATTTAKGAKVYRWAPWACSRFGIPAKVGGTFDYTSARNGETHTHKVTKVAADGKVESVRTD